MSQSRRELLEAQVLDNGYTRTFDFNAEAETGFTEAVTLGLAGAVVSGGVGMINTGIAVGQMFGADIDQIKTEEVLESWAWTDTHDYYLDNKEIVDAVGFGLSTIIPGMAGLKAAKWAQSAKWVNTSENLGAVGLRKILVPESATLNYGRLIAKDSLHVANRNAVTRKAAATGFHQAAVETAFAETAILLSTNQHVTVNQDNLGYFGAMWEQKDGALFGLGLGTGIGGVVLAARNYKAITGLIKAKGVEHNKLSEMLMNYDSKGNQLNFDQGNRVVGLSQRLKQIQETHFELSSSEMAAVNSRISELETTLREEVAALTGELTGKVDNIGRRELQGHLTKSILDVLDRGTIDEVADTLLGATSIGKFDDHDVLFDPMGISFSAADDAYRQTVGKAVASEDAYLAAINATTPTQAQKNLLAKVDAATAGSGDLGVSNTELRKQLTSLQDEIAEGTVDLSTYAPEHVLTAIRQELGHGSKANLNHMFQNAEFKVYRDEMVELSRAMKPTSWNQLDGMMKERAKLVAKGDKLSMADAERLTQIDHWNEYMHNPLELLSDSWTAFNGKTPKMQALAATVGANTKKVFMQNGALKLRLGSTEKLLALKSGKMYDTAQWAPTIADRGKVTFSNGIVSAGTTSVKIKKNTFSILTATPDEASAHYYAAAHARDTIKKEAEVVWDNFYELNRIQTAIADERWAGKLSITKSDGTKELLDFTDEGMDSAIEFDTVFRSFKQEAALKLNTAQIQKNRNFTPSDIGRVLDVDEDFALDVGTNLKTEAFWSRTNDVTQPTVAKIFYKSAVDENRQVSSALAEVTSQNLQVYQLADEAVTSLAKALDDENGLGLTLTSLVDTAPRPSYIAGGYGEMNDITQGDQLTGVFKTFIGEYGESSSKGQAIAKFNELFKLKGDEIFQTKLANDAQLIQGNPEAVMELNALDSLLRQRFYKFAPQLKTTQEVSEYLVAKATVQPLIAQKNLARILASPEGQGLVAKLREPQLIWTRETESLLAKAMNQQRFQKGILTKLGQSISSDIKQIKSPDVFNFWKNKVSANEWIVDGKRTASAARGLGSTLDAGVLYPGTIDANKYKYLSYVIPKKAGVWGRQQKGIIGANTPQELAQKKIQVQEAFGNDVVVATKEEMERSFQLEGKYLDEFSLDEFQANRDLMRKGIMWDVAPEPNKNLVKHYITDMQRDWHGTVDNLTELKYAEEFAALDQMDFVAQSFGSRGRGAQDKIANPASEMQRIMLNRSNSDSSSKWRDAQASVDKVITKAWNSMTSAYKVAVASDSYSEMNAIMDHYGLPKVYGKAEGAMLRTSLNTTDQVMAGIIPKLNGIAGTLMLRLDAIQPMVNALSMPIMSVPEMDVLMKSIPKLQAQSLAKSLHSTVPGTEYGMASNLKLQMQAVKDYFTPEGAEALERYYKEGIISNVLREVRQVADGITIDPALTSTSMLAKINNSASKMANILATPTDRMEDFVKFVAARQAELLLDAANITDKSVRSATLRSYTTRVHGNYVSAQRPAIFQGFAGQAIGLFQTYQFNLIQSLLSKVGDKNATAVSAMMGLQAGIFGAQSVPGFKMMNDYVAMNSNEDNDFYTGAQAAVGTEESEWVLFGLASNFTKPIFHAANYLLDTDMKAHGLELYTRGDLNPRTPLLIPTSLDEVPIWSMSTKFVGNILNAATDLSRGVDAGQVFADSLAHNGVNRPLAGVGAILASSGIPGFGNSVRTTSKGSLIANLSDLNWFAKAARVAGTKTLDESIAVQSFYRTKAYDTKRQEAIQDLGRSAKRMIQSGNYEEEAYTSFMHDYTTIGGRAEHFNKWMHSQALGATESTITNLYKSNTTHSGRYLQKLMGNNIEQFINPTLNPVQSTTPVDYYEE